MHGRVLSCMVPALRAQVGITRNQGLNCQKISGGVDICLFIVAVITHRQFSITNNGGGGGGLKLTPPPGVSQGILFGGVEQTTGGFNPPTPPAIQTLHVTWIKSTANKIPNTFSNLMQAEHDNVTETCLCGMAMACGHVMHKFFVTYC
jgi:hypothetical protein